MNAAVFTSFQRWTDPSGTRSSTRFGSKRLPLIVQWLRRVSRPNLQVFATFSGTL